MLRLEVGMTPQNVPSCDVTVVVRTCDDEERIGHVLRRVASHLCALELSFEILVADEGSGDNTGAVVALWRSQVPEIELLHTQAWEAYFRGCQRARGRVVVLLDARVETPLSALSFALGRLRDGLDVVALSGRYLVFKRTRVWRAFDALIQRRDPLVVERRFLRRVKALGLRATVTHPRRQTRWGYLRETLLAPHLTLRSFT
jgi:glycosyltransferase involved in cell wall biosynthesis